MFVSCSLLQFTHYWNQFEAILQSLNFAFGYWIGILVSFKLPVYCKTQILHLAIGKIKLIVPMGFTSSYPIREGIMSERGFTVLHV